jgi:hypothetical protein
MRVPGRGLEQRESEYTVLCLLGDNRWPVEPLGESVEACGRCMKVWSEVVEGEMKWTAAITGDRVGFFG